MEPDIAPVLHVDGSAGIAHDEHFLQRGNAGLERSLVNVLFQRNGTSATQTLVGGHDHCRFAIDNASGKGVRRKAAEYH